MRSNVSTSTITFLQKLFFELGPLKPSAPPPGALTTNLDATNSCGVSKWCSRRERDEKRLVGLARREKVLKMQTADQAASAIGVWMKGQKGAQEESRVSKLGGKSQIQMAASQLGDSFHLQNCTLLLYPSTFAFVLSGGSCFSGVSDWWLLRSLSCHTNRNITITVELPHTWFHLKQTVRKNIFLPGCVLTYAQHIEVHSISLVLSRCGGCVVSKIPSNHNTTLSVYPQKSRSLLWTEWSHWKSPPSVMYDPWKKTCSVVERSSATLVVRLFIILCVFCAAFGFGAVIVLKLFTFGGGKKNITRFVSLYVRTLSRILEWISHL